MRKHQSLFSVFKDLLFWRKKKTKTKTKIILSLKPQFYGAGFDMRNSNIFEKLISDSLLYFCTPFARFVYESLICDVLMEIVKGPKQYKDKYHLELSESCSQIYTWYKKKVCKHLCNVYDYINSITCQYWSVI